MQRIAAHARVVAASITPVLITGERGVGKQHLARCLHEASARADGPYVAISCAGVSEPELDAAIFGGVSRLGWPIEGAVASASGGTLLLEDVADLTPVLQAKLVRLVREEWGARGVRGTRLVAATSADLERPIADGTFRPDLFYRLSVARFHLPTLRERAADIVPLAEFFVSRFCANAGLPDKVLDRDAVERLMAEAWPANIDGLKRAVEHAAASAGDAPVIVAEDLPEDVGRSVGDAAAPRTNRARAASSLPVTPLCHPVRVPSHGSVGPRPVQLWACQYPYPSLRASGPDDSCGDCPLWPAFRQARAAGCGQ
jgi:DNA-binding NtrC family response regulator